LALPAGATWARIVLVGERDVPDGVEVLAEDECRDLLASGSLGRIAFSLGDQPEIFPVNYAADGSLVVFRTASGTKILEAVKRRVAFEVDGWDPDTRYAWSVIVKGIAEEVTAAIDPFAAALRKLPVYPMAPGEREQTIAVYPSEISGRRFHRE
jgi:uncharacterized protein